MTPINPLFTPLLTALREIRRLRKANRRGEQKFNRVKNQVPGLARIYILDNIAMEFEMMADEVDRMAVEGVTGDLARKNALFIRRLEWDLVELNIAAWDRIARDGSKYDPLQWRGPRP